MAFNRSPKKRLTRKQFLKLSAAGAAGLLAGCQTAAPSDTPVQPDKTVPPAAPATTPTAGGSNIGLKYPDAPSRVVHTRGVGVWDGDELSQSIARLTGQENPRDGWAALFSPDDRIAIKVNAFYNSLIWTHVPLVTAVTDCLQDAGVPADRIVLYDQTSDELTTAGFAVNRDGAGVRCHGSDKSYEENTDIGGTLVPLSPVLKDCTALINMPVLKGHMLAGITFAMKNHFGSVRYPEMLHSGIAKKIAQLNALPEIKDRTRLVIGDILEANLEYGTRFPYWTADYRGDSILMSFDPVAHDAVGLEILNRLLADAGKRALSLQSIAESSLAEAAALGLGTDQAEHMERIDVSV
jgi:hypothetical protein